MSIPGPKTIRINTPTDLIPLLDQLGIPHSPSPSPDQSIELTEKDCERAGISFRFIQAFAQLTQAKEYPISAAERLLAKREPPKFKIDFLASLLNKEDSRTEKIEILPFKSSLLELVFDKLMKRKDFPSSPTQQELDEQMDSQEMKALRTALMILDENETSPDATEHPFHNADLVKKRINALGAHPCWLTVEAMETGLFGVFNGQINPQLGVIHASGIPTTLRETNSAKPFKCEYLSEMNHLSYGIFFSPENIPPSIQKAAQSVVKIKTKTGMGSGVVIAPGYILTALHVVESKGRTAEFILTVGGTTFKTEATILPVPKTEGIYLAPDLAILYVPNLPVAIEPIRFSSMLQASPSQDNTPPFDLKLSNGMQNIYMVGIPYQERKNPGILVSVGSLDEYGLQLDYNGLLTTNATILPGNSGGPALDSKGKLVGIAVAMDLESDNPNFRRYREFEREFFRYYDEKRRPEEYQKRFFRQFQEFDREEERRELKDKLKFKDLLKPGPETLTSHRSKQDSLAPGFLSVVRKKIIGSRIHPIALWSEEIKDTIRRHQRSLVSN